MFIDPWYFQFLTKPIKKNVTTIKDIFIVPIKIVRFGFRILSFHPTTVDELE